MNVDQRRKVLAANARRFDPQVVWLSLVDRFRQACGRSFGRHAPVVV